MISFIISHQVQFLFFYSFSLSQCVTKVSRVCETEENKIVFAMRVLRAFLERTVACQNSYNESYCTI